MFFLQQPCNHRQLLLLHVTVTFFLLISFFPFFSFSQLDSPQNIETFFQDVSLAPPTFPSPTPPSVPGLPPPRTPGPITRAVLITAFSTLAAAVLFFLLLQRFVEARRRRARVPDANYTSNIENGGPRRALAREDFTRFKGNVKGLIVDEDGLDILYWKKLQRSNNSFSFRREVVGYDEDEEKEEEEKKVIYSKNRRKQDPVLEVRLLRGMSSTSHSIIHQEIQEPEYQNYIKTNRFNAVGNPEKNSQPAPAEHKGTSAAPPPPPPPPPQSPATANTSASLPPPPPPKAAVALASSSSKPPPIPKGSTTSGEASGQVKLKPLHWDKVNPESDHTMVWDKIYRGSFSFDGDLMEALFGYVASSKRFPTESRKANPGSSSSAQIFILDPRKSQNTAIVLKSLSISREELIEALLEGHDIDTDTLDKLSRIALTQDEQSAILDYEGDPRILADADSFLFHLLQAVPSAFTRLTALLFKSNYYPEINHHKKSLQTLDLACKELRARGLFVRLLEAILKAGNRMNAGTARGNAQAFNLTALRKLSDVKSVDGKTTLLHFVVEEVVRSEGKRCATNSSRSSSPTSSKSESGSESSVSNQERETQYMQLGLPVVGGLSAEFSNVKKAAAIDYDAFAATCSALSARAKDTRRVLRGDETGFGKKMKGFLDSAEQELKAVRDEQITVMELVKRTTEYYQTGALKDRNPLQLFVIVKDFLGMVDQVCAEIARNMQKRKAGTTSDSPAPRNGVKFPKLPPNFMSEDTRSDSTDSFSFPITK